MLAFAGLLTTSCDESFSNWTEPEFNPQEEAITVPGLTATAQSAATINLAEAGDTVKLLSLSEAPLPQGAQLGHLRMVASPVGVDAEPVTIEAIDDKGNFSKQELQKVVTNFYGPAPEARTLNAKVYLDLVNDGQSSYVDAGSITIMLTPSAPQISANYYVVGGTLDWAGSAASKEQKFSHSGKNVYEDPIFTIVINAAEGDTWFAIGDDEACDAIANNGDWSKLFGTTDGNGQNGLTGKMDRRYNLSDDGSFCVPAGNKKIKITLNMMTYTYTIEPVNIAENYYLIGGPGNWDSSKNQKFSHSNKDVFEDPVFTYVFESNGGEMWFAFGDDEAIDAVGEGVWNKLYGTKGDSKDLSGSFDRRYNLDGDHSFCVDGSAKLYRFSINMAEMTYEITPLNFSEYVYFIGATDGWQAADQKLASPSFDGIYTGFVYCADPNGWGNQFKFQRVAGSWDNEINSATFTSITGDFGTVDGNTNIEAKAGEGVYYVKLDLANLTLDAVKVSTMGIIGDFNGWGGDVEMTWNATDYCFEATNAGVNANGWKFRINGDWGINLGSNDSTEPSTVINDLVANGKNIGVAGQTIKLYPTRKTSDKIYCTVE